MKNFYKDACKEEMLVIDECQHDLAMLVRSERLRLDKVNPEINLVALLANVKASLAEAHMTNMLFARISAADPQALVLEFTKTERNVLRLLLDGKRSKAIAPLLGIGSWRTVDTHIGKIYKKCGTKDKRRLCSIFGEGQEVSPAYADAVGL
jgi:DNA-binding NarL/FixJ family response regulator